MHKIMLATDFSERSDRALRRAVLLARDGVARIDLVHVIDDDRPRRIVDHETVDATALLGELADTLEQVDGVPCEVHVAAADPFAGIAKAVEDRRPDLLVIGPHRRQILRDIFVGTTAERTIRAVGCPILMVNGPPVGRYRHVMLTTDLSDDSCEALRRFDRLAIGAAADRTILHVFDAPALRLAMSGTMALNDQEDYIADQRAEARQALSRFMATVGSDRRAALIVRPEETSVANDVLRAASDLRADLIVVATGRKGPVTRMLIGSVTQQILTEASVDVLALPALGTIEPGGP